jgi:hypothetical protein
MSRRVKFGEREFSTMALAKTAIQSVLWRYDLKQSIDVADTEFISAVFGSHPKYDQKCAGRTIDRFEVHPQKYQSRCFYAVFEDGSMIQFSYKPCISGAASTANG